ncbi:MAG TPA: hypothetical protein VNL71_18165 [Chloroflexota bacterium]|nr:hypothetical protein [Chloroflexota bacterium]
MRRRLPALLALLVGVAVVLGGLEIRGAFSSTSPPAPALPPNVVAIGSNPHASQETAVALGVSAGIDDRLDPSIAAVLREAGVRVVRFGGLGSDDYNWETGCRYGDSGSQRECTGAPGKNGVLDKFLRFAAQVGAQPIIVVNGEVDDPQQAARMVSYYEEHCLPDLTRPSRPCLQPYWEIGNSPANWKHFAVPLAARLPDDAYTIQPDQYAALVVSYAAAMRRVAPCGGCLKIVADEWITGATDQSWTDAVTVIDTHYSPLLYSSSVEPVPSESAIITAAQSGFGGRPSIDIWLSDLRESLDQFTNGQRIGIMVGQWSIDANALQEPAVYGGYVQAIFAADLFIHFWHDAQPGGPNPLLLATQYPLSGGAQEPFDIATGLPRPATRVYALVDHYLGAHPLPVSLGGGLRREGILAAAAVNDARQASVLLVNSDQHHAHQLTLQGLPSGPRDLWWFTQDGDGNAGPLQHTRLAGATVTLPPWSIAVLQVE